MSSKKSRYRGRFIVFEGIDGAGTTTQLRHTIEWLERRGELVYATKEPTEGPIGTMLRQIMRGRMMSRVKGQPQPMDPSAVALLFAADRLDHIQNEIVPLLEEGRHVICDRYLMSSLAYQALDCDLRFVRNINEKALAPDLTIFLKVRPEIAMDRIESARPMKDSFEQLPLQRKIAANYEKLLETSREGEVVILDGEAEPSIVMTKVRQALEPLF